MEMSLREKVAGILGSPSPIKVGHRYTDHVTEERFDVISVGRRVKIERLDAERRPDSEVLKETFRRAIDHGFVGHDPERCPECAT